MAKQRKPASLQFLESRAQPAKSSTKAVQQAVLARELERTQGNRKQATSVNTPSNQDGSRDVKHFSPHLLSLMPKRDLPFRRLKPNASARKLAEREKKNLRECTIPFVFMQWTLEVSDNGKRCTGKIGADWFNKPGKNFGTQRVGQGDFPNKQRITLCTEAHADGAAIWRLRANIWKL